MKKNTIDEKITKEITTIEKITKEIKITNPPEMIQATEMLSKANQTLDALTDSKELLTKPLNQALKEVRERYKPAETILTEVISRIRNSMSSYQTKELQKKREKEIELAGKIASGDLSLEQASTKLSNIKNAPKTVETGAGSVRFRTDKILRITSIDKLPRMYLIPDERALLSALKLGNIIPGAEIEEVQTPINSR